jgi:HAD superfamily hydrolase (TIGR01484 family)
MKYKLLVLDVDGVLVDSQGEVYKDNIKAIYRVVARDVKVALATCRPPKYCRRLLNELKLHGCHIFFNGALVSYTNMNRTVYTQPIQLDTLRKMIGCLDSSSLFFKLYTVDRFYVENSNWPDTMHSKGSGSSIDYIEDISQNQDILEITTVAKTETQLEKANLLKKQFTEELKFSIARSPAFHSAYLVNVNEIGVVKRKCP